jgi:diguanylate cyclase (GGDEF)-like protein
VALTLGHLALGGFRRLGALGWWEVAAVGLLLAGVGLGTARRLRRASLGAPPRFADALTLDASLVALAYAVVAVAGAALFPLVYLLVAALVSFLPLGAGVAVVAVALAFEAAVTLPPWGSGVAVFAAHGTFLVLFSALFHGVLWVRMLKLRRAESQAVHRRVREAEEQARTFRLVNAGTHDAGTPTAEDQDKWLLAAISEIEGAVGAALEVAEAALRTHACAAFLLTSDDRALKLYDCRSQDDRLLREPFPAGEGILGGVLKRRAPLRMASAAGLKGVSYYEPGAADVTALLAVPIVERSVAGDHAGLLRGVLVADRLGGEPFTAQDEKVLSTVAEQVLRAIEVERVTTYIRKARDEKDRFFRTLEGLNRAGKMEDVFAAVLESAGQLGGLDFTAVTLVKTEGGKLVHQVMRVAGDSASGTPLVGRSFADNTGLVANVVRYGTPLPGRELKAMDRQLIFDDPSLVRGLSALKIFPLKVNERVVGTLVAGSRRRPVIDEETLRMLEVLSLQAAQSVERAEYTRKMEQMATTDGLTGLVNHRTFQQKADELLAQARRYGRKCAVLLTDVDHFKSVNDTYGHSTGDLVLKGVARILREQARDTDVVARYGGEEFCIVMPETDVKGARVIAERIREAIRAEVFQTEMGPLKVTISLGVAACPEDGTEKQALIDLADQCLYHAKRSGRNRTVTVAEMRAGPRLKAAGT